MLVLPCLFVTSIRCKKEKITDNNYFGGKIMILGHRGMGAYYKKPGNTMESILPAINIGVDGCEIDIQLTKDSILVLFHDLTLDAKTTCQGKISETNWVDVKSCKYFAVENNIYIYSLDEIFSSIPELNQFYFSFDSKLDEEIDNFSLYQDRFLRAIKRLCEKYNMGEHILLEGKEPYLNRARELGLTARLFYTGPFNKENIEIASNNNYFGICSEMESITIETDLAHEKGLYIMSYTPNNYYSNLIAIDKNIDILQTDDPISILKLFNRFNYDYIIP